VLARSCRWQLDPFGKIPEFKYCEAKIEAAGKPAMA
jgi:hypothetical protein